MLSSNLLSLIAIATFALTTSTAAAAAIKPRADSNSNKVCPNVVYNTPQCCVPNDSGLAEPDCITREFHIPFLFPSDLFLGIHANYHLHYHLLFLPRWMECTLVKSNQINIADQLFFLADFSCQCRYCQRSEGFVRVWGEERGDVLLRSFGRG